MSLRRLMSGGRVTAFLLAGGILFAALLAAVQVTVWVDFTSDTHNGSTGGANGKADWIDELDKLAAGAGIDPFTAAERTTIEAGIVTKLTTTFSGYSISFTTAAPAGPTPFDAIAYGLNSTGISSGTKGTAPTDVANIASGQVGGIVTANFKDIVDEFAGTGAGRGMQIAQLTTALAGTGAHEISHTFGMSHQYAYSHPSITPATYASTGGVQNGYIAATGETGLTEAGREAARTIDPWSKVLFDVSGGAAAGIGGAHQSLVFPSAPVMIDLSEESPGVDAGPSIASAKTMSLTMGAKSGRLIGFVSGNPDGPGFMGDVDVWKISVPGAGSLTAGVYSVTRFASGGYDTKLALLDSSGTVLWENTDVHFLGDKYNDPADPLEETDPFLLNVPIPSAGDYYLRVVPEVGADVGASDAYWLIAGVSVATVPEPTSTTLAATGAAIFAAVGAPRRGPRERHGKSQRV